MEAMALAVMAVGARGMGVLAVEAMVAVVSGAVAMAVEVMAVGMMAAVATAMVALTADLPVEARVGWALAQAATATVVLGWVQALALGGREAAVEALQMAVEETYVFAMVLVAAVQAVAPRMTAASMAVEQVAAVGKAMGDVALEMAVALAGSRRI